MKEIVITSSVLILCIMLIRVIFKGKISSRLQYALWILVALRLVIPASAQIYMAIGSIEEFRIMDLTKRLEARVGDVTEPLEQPVAFVTSMNGVVGKLAADYILEHDGDPFTTADGPTSVFIAGKIGFTWLDVFRGIWIGGMVVVALWMIITNLIFMRKLHKGRKEFVLPESLYENLPQDVESLETKDGKRSNLISRTKIYTVEGLASPCLYGIPFREAVYLNPDVAEDSDRLRHVLTHEMCHKRHGDSFWSILRSILLVIYWMNPLVWVAAVLSKRDCELACDEEALLVLGEEERIPYGETLLSIITRKGKLSDIACTATTMTGSGKSVKERIKYIAEKPRVLGATVVAVLILVMAISVLVFTKNPLFHGDTWEGEIALTAGDMQVTLPETIAGISGYEIDDDGSIIIYQVASGEEAGRFCEVSYGEAVTLWEQGREVIPIGDYGRNMYLRQYMSSIFPSTTTEHIYTPNSSVTTHDYYAPDQPADDAGILYHEDFYYYEPGSEGVPGTDSNDDDTSYIIENSAPATEDGVHRYYIPSPQDTDWEVIALTEEEIEEEIELTEEELARMEKELALAQLAELETELQERELMLNEVKEMIESKEEELAVLKQHLEEIKRGGGGVSVPGTDSNSDETTYIIEDDGAFTSQSVSESIHYPTEEIDGVGSADYPPDELAGESRDYTPEEITGESINYLPNEEITVTYTPGNALTKCYIYMKGDYAGINEQYLDEISYIDSILKTVAGEQVIVTESD